MIDQLAMSVIKREFEVDLTSPGEIDDITEMQIKQKLSNDDSLSNQASDTLDQLNSNNNSVSQCTATVNEHVSPYANGQIDVANNLIKESGHHELIGANVDQQFTQMFESNDAQANVNEEVNHENGMVNGDRENADLIGLYSHSAPPSTSFNLNYHQQHSNENEMQLNTVEMIEINKEEVEDGDETELIERLTEDNQGGRECPNGENAKIETMDCVEPEIMGEFDYGHEIEVKQEEEEDENEVDDTQVNDEEDMSNTANGSHDGCVELAEPSTSAQQQTNPIASTQPTGSNRLNLTKRKQSQSNRSVKRSKETVGDEGEEEEEDVSDDIRVDGKFRVLHFNCTEQNCEAKLKSLDHLYEHLRTYHRLCSFQCFAQNCNLRFDSRSQIRPHIKLQHSTSTSTKFACHVCYKEFALQKNTADHWSKCHLTGQFECNLNECYRVFGTRDKLYAHQKNNKHGPEWKRFHCQHDGCEASFGKKHHLEQHEKIHANSKPFECTWTDCSYRTKRRPTLVRHIRMCHFGLPATLKEQLAKNMVDEGDPNEYVRVVD